MSNELIEKAVNDFRKGRCVLIYDWPDRESEVDMVCYAGYVDVDMVYMLRKEAGGLICYATEEYVANVLGLPFQVDMLSNYENLKLLIKRPRYGDASPFTVWVNSVDVRTGISDEDRAKTIRKLHEVVALILGGGIEEGKKLFYKSFYSPGHVPILIAKDLRRRRGHTELAIAFAKMAGLLPSVVFAEMLSYGKSMSLEEAREYAERRGLSLISGEDIVRYAERLGLV